MRRCDHIDTSTPQERLREIASILAEGVLRLRRRSALPAASADISAPAESPSDSLSESFENDLEVSAGPRLSGHRG